jgi:hypothetical protein
MSCLTSALPVLAPKSCRPLLHPHQNRKSCIKLDTLEIPAKMSACVACNKPLEVEFERDEDEEYETGASSSSGKAPAAAPEMVPDDVQMSCGCHFHWLVFIEGQYNLSNIFLSGTVF